MAVFLHGPARGKENKDDASVPGSRVWGAHLRDTSLAWVLAVCSRSHFGLTHGTQAAGRVLFEQPGVVLLKL